MIRQASRRSMGLMSSLDTTIRCTHTLSIRRTSFVIVKRLFWRGMWVAEPEKPIQSIQFMQLPFSSYGTIKKGPSYATCRLHHLMACTTFQPMPLPGHPTSHVPVQVRPPAVLHLQPERAELLAALRVRGLHRPPGHRLSGVHPRGPGGAGAAGGRGRRGVGRVPVVPRGVPSPCYPLTCLARDTSPHRL